MSSGTEAVMTAVRIARGYTGKHKIVKFNGCYHGHLDSMLIKAGSGLAGTAEASSKGITPEMAKDTLICELGDLKELEQIFDQHPNQIAGVFIEPLPANNGLLIQKKEFLEGLSKLCKKHNALLVFDEVISGFRVGFGGMALETGITPDIVTYGKIIGGGMPVGAVGGKKEIMESLAPVGPVYQAGTLSGNPVAMAAGLATMKQLTAETYTKIETNTKNIISIFEKWSQAKGFEDYKMLQKSSLFWAHPDKTGMTNISEISPKLSERFFKLFQVLLDKGIYLAPNAWEVGFVSLAHDEKVQKDLEARLWS
jgi:glutamate-1-semialdehyde 2,1-aminomutase